MIPYLAFEPRAYEHSLTAFDIVVRAVQDQEREQRDCLVMSVPREAIDTVTGRLHGTAARSARWFVYNGEAAYCFDQSG